MPAFCDDRSPLCVCVCVHLSNNRLYSSYYYSISRLKAELQFLRKKGALKATSATTTTTAINQQQQQQQPVPSSSSSSSSNSRCCARCRTSLGRIINRGALCKSCRQRVCKACREYGNGNHPSPHQSVAGNNNNNTDWVCTVCYKSA